MENLTTMQIKYLANKELKGTERIVELKRLLNRLETKKYKHNNKSEYKYIFGNNKLISDSEHIMLYVNGYIDTTYYKWKYEQLKNAIINDIYIYEYKELKNKIKEFYFENVVNKWLNIEQYNKLKLLLNSFNLLTTTSYIRKCKASKKPFIMFENKKYYCIIENGKKTYLMDESKVSNKIDLIKNKIDLSTLETVLNELKQENFINVYKLKAEHKTNNNLNTITLLADIITDDIKEVKKYFYNNTYKELLFKDEYNYSII